MAASSIAGEDIGVRGATTLRGVSAILRGHRKTLPVSTQRIAGGWPVGRECCGAGGFAAHLLVVVVGEPGVLLVPLDVDVVRGVLAVEVEVEVTVVVAVDVLGGLVDEEWLDVVGVVVAEL